MKKIIALAVAAAAMPAMAAVTVSGDLEMRLTSADNKSMSASYDDSDFAITATSELNNGMVVTGKVAIDDVAGAAGTNADVAGDVEFHIAGAFGKLSLGEVDSASQMFDEKAEVNPIGVGDAGSNSSSTMQVTYTLPTLAEGLSVAVSASVSNASTDTLDDVASSAVGIQYSVAGFTIGAGMDSMGDNNKDKSSFGASYAVNGFYVGVQSGKNNTAGEDDFRAMGASYTMGNLTLGAESYDDGSVADSGSTSFAAKYNLGGGAAVYVDLVNKDVANSDSTVVGLTYAF
ncbi:porin [Litorivicinus lipolyticus]|uniref:Porin n=1 Tax=Litorivicinus lipolyticus TaxID=418701 RepID=A0A5Q2Q739_9GAMM|nr:porin [Litorivicinus lipolyticus]QGG79708.1 porin [Litorivicinus lipolyticus]